MCLMLGLLPCKYMYIYIHFARSCLLFQDIPVNPEKDFPDIHADVTGSHGQKLFKVDKSHGRVFLPEQVLEQDEGLTRPITLADEESLVSGCISECPQEVKEPQEVVRRLDTPEPEKGTELHVSVYSLHCINEVSGSTKTR